MAADLTSRLPNEEGRTHRASQEWRLSVGMRTGNSTSNLGFWMLKRHVTERGSDQRGTCIIDRERQDLLEGMNDSDQPRVLPCNLIGNAQPDELNPGQWTVPDSIMFREIAWFGNGPRLCYCQNPQDPSPIAHRAIRESAGTGGKQYMRITGYEEVPCSREHPDKPCLRWKADKDPCRNHIIVTLFVPWAGTSGACVYRPTGDTAFDSMLNSLQQIADITGGFLHGLPMEFVYEEKQVGADKRWVPAPRFRLVNTEPKAALREATQIKCLLAASSESGDANELIASAAQHMRARIVGDMEHADAEMPVAPEPIEAEFEAGEPTAEEQAQIKQEELDAYKRDYGEKQPQSLFPKEGE